MRAKLTALLSLLLAACAGSIVSPIAPPSLDGDPLYHLARVDAHLYRSAQPTHDDLVRLHKHLGICRVIQLDQWWEAREDQPVLENGVQVLDVVRIPLSVTAGEIDGKILDAILYWIEASPCPVLVHCYSGQDRTGLIVALYELRNGVLVEDAWAEMWRHHWHPYPPLAKAFYRAAGWPY